MKILLICFSLLWFANAKVLAQVVDLNWSGSMNLAISEDVTVAPNGEKYVIGYFFNNADLDPGLSVNQTVPNGTQDVFIIKLDQNNNLIWSKILSGSELEYNVGSLVDEEGNLFISGNFGGTVDFDPGIGVANHTASGPRVPFLLKLDEMGEYVWAKTYNTNGYSSAAGMCLDDNGFLYLTGSFMGQIDFDMSGPSPLIMSQGGSDGFVVKLESEGGDFIWAKTFGGSMDDGGGFICEKDDGLYVQGFFEFSANFNLSGPSEIVQSNGLSDIFILKLDTTGQFQWVRAFGNTDFDFARGIDIGANDKVISIGNFRNTVDFDPSANSDIITSVGSEDFFIHSLDVDGNYIGCTSFGGPNADPAYEMELDEYGGIYIAGMYRDSVDFNNAGGTDLRISNGLSDAFILKTDNNGLYSWCYTFGSVENDQAGTIDITPLDHIFITGFYRDSMVVYQGPQSTVELSEHNGSFLLDFVLQNSGAKELFFGDIITISPNPVKNELYIEFNKEGKYQVTIFDSQGRKTNVSETMLNKGTLDVSGLIPGVYLLKESAGITVKFVKI